MHTEPDRLTNCYAKIAIDYTNLMKKLGTITFAISIVK